MTDAIYPSLEVITATVTACVLNGEKLEAESYDLEFRDPPSLQLYILLIAQEEFAKAFLLLLVRDGIIPFTRPLLRAMNDHSCKQLVGIVMDHIIMHWDTLEEVRRMMDADLDLGDRLPAAVESAVMLLRFEKIGRWQSRAWKWVEPPEYEREMVKLAEGSADRRKQDALYIRVGSDGRVCPSSIIKPEHIEREKGRLRDFSHLVEAFTVGKEVSYRQQATLAFIREVFAELVE